MLVVIAIIAILAGIAIPSIGSAVKKARITQARTEITSIVNAINAFEGEYSVLPVLSLTGAAGSAADLKLTDVRADADNPNKSSDNSKSDSKTYDALMQILAAQDITSSHVADNTVVDLWSTKAKRDGAQNAKGGILNPRNKIFLNVPQTFKDKGFRDPWGTRYVIMLDADYNGKIENFPKSNEDLRGSVFVYSYGPNRIDDKGQNTANSGVPKTDDITSWDVQ